VNGVNVFVSCGDFMGYITNNFSEIEWDDLDQNSDQQLLHQCIRYSKWGYHLKLYHGLYDFIVFVVVNSNTWLNMMWLIYLTGWWFGTFVIFLYIGNSNPNCLSYFSEGLKPPTSNASDSKWKWCVFWLLMVVCQYIYIYMW
jgi:hypothetical protein